jgi:predicted nuclease of predicted toxin-antitoxin system
MKIKLDENLPASLAPILKGFQHDVHTTADENLTGRTDGEVWEATQREQRFLITQDLDFSDVRQFMPGRHHGILLVRLRDPDRRSLIFRLQEIFRHEPVNSWAECFVVATERKIRVIRPETS